MAIGMLWQSARWDADLGLYLMRYRWYDPELGQFLSRDPLGLWGDAKNLGHGTLFAGNDPINFVDPYGLRGWAAQCGASARDWSNGNFSEGILGSIGYGVVHAATAVAFVGEGSAEAYEGHEAYEGSGRKLDWWDRGLRVVGDLGDAMSLAGGLGAGAGKLATPGKGVDAAADASKGAKGIGRATTLDDVAAAQEFTEAAPRLPSVSAAPAKSCPVEKIPTQTPDPISGIGYGPSDPPARIMGPWTEGDIQRGLDGYSPRSLGSPDLHHAGQMPGSAVHEILPDLHRGNRALHPNRFNQGVTDQMRASDRRLHWWYRAREQGGDHLFPGDIYD